MNKYFFMVMTTFTDDWLGSRLKTRYTTIVRKVKGENEWDIYFRTRSVKKRVWSLLHYITVLIRQD